jgi:uncharacterized membrane protein
MRDRVLNAESIWLWSVLTLGGVLRFYRLDFQSLWYDEGLQYYVVSNNSLGELLSQTRSFHPPLSFLTNYAFLLFGQSEFFLRLPSALFGFASLPVFYILTQELTSKRVALVSTFVLAVSPFHVWYSQDGRMYSQLLFFSLLSSVLLLESIRRSELRWWAYYVLVSAAGIYTHIFMLLILVAQFIWVIVHQRRRAMAHATSGATVFILFLPWIILLPWVQGFFRSIAEHGLGSGAKPAAAVAFRAGFSWESIPYTFFAYSSGFSLGPTVAELHENRSLGFILQFAPEVFFVSVIFGPLIIVGIYALYREFGAQTASFCLLSIFIPILGTLLYSLAPWAAYNVRYTIVAFPCFCIFVGAGLTLLSEKRQLLGATFTLGVALVIGTSLANHFFNPRYHKEDVRSAVAFWRSESNAVPILSYQSYPVVFAYLYDSERERHVGLGRDVVSNMKAFFSKSEVPAVYVLLSRDWKGLKENALKRAYPIELEKTFPGVKLLKISNVPRQNSLGAM